MKFFFKILCIYFILVQTVFSAQLNLSTEEKAFLKEHPVLKVGGTSNFEPLFIANDDGSIDGLLPELYDVLAKRLGIKFQYVDDDWQNIPDLLKNKKIDIIGIINKEIAKSSNFLYTPSPFSYQITLFAKKNNPLNIETEDDLNNLRVVYCDKIKYIDTYLKTKKHLKLIKAETPFEAFSLLAENKADVMIGIDFDSYVLIKNSLLNIEPLFSVKSLQSGAAIGFHPESQILKSIIQKAINSLSVEEKNTILRKWTWIADFKDSVALSKEERTYLANKKVLRVQNLSTLPPFNFIENGVPSGYTIDYLKLVAQEIGIDLEFISGKTWSEYLQMIKEDKIDIIPHVAITKERLDYIDFTNFNHIEYITGVAIRKGETINSMKDLENKVIAVANKTFLHTFLKNNFPNQSLLLTTSTANAVQAVSDAKADAVISSLPSLQYYTQKNWLSNLKIVKITGLEAIEKTKLPMGVPKGNKILKSILEKANREIPYVKIVDLKNKWMNNFKAPTIKASKLTKEEFAYLKNKKVIKMCVLPDWLPFEQIDEEGKHKGIGNDIMQIISKYLNIPIELVATKEWSQSLKNIRERKCDILPVSMNIPSRRDSMNFTKPYVSEPFMIATKNDELFIKNIDGLSNKKVGVVKSYSTIEILKSANPLIDVVGVKNTKEGLEKVSNGELFAYIDTMPTISYFIQRYGLVDLTIAGKLNYDLKLSIASRNDEPLLNEVLQKALDTIDAEEMRKIVGKWIEIKVQQEFHYEKLIYLSILFLVIILISLYKNRSIRKINNKLSLAHNELREQQRMVNKYVLIIETDLAGVITYVNKAYCKATGFNKDELVGKTHKDMRHPSIEDSFFEKMWDMINTNNSWSGEIINYTKDRQELYFYMNIEPIIKEDKKIGYRAICEDITDKKRIEELSVTDKLTGIYNRLKLDQMILKHIQSYQRYKTEFSIILLDIDNFKAVNDTYGHDVGDKVLKTLSNILKANTRITDIIGRWGGEEFLIICSNTNLDNSYTLAENLRKMVAQEKFADVGHLSVSLGVSTFEKDDTITSIFKRADEALYEAKNKGKNRTVKN